MTPVDPRIHHRCFNQWQCEECGVVKGHGEELWTLFNCEQCDTDLCLSCFSGHRHYLHPHGLVKIVQEPGGMADPTLSCQLCSRQLLEPHYFTCRDPSCRFTICQQCFRHTPPPHPLHIHTLFCSDPTQVYPQSGGVWHCDNCTARHPQGKQTPLSPTDSMYHCAVCQFDLCEDCYKHRQHLTTKKEYAGVSRQRHFLTAEEAYKRPPVARPAVTFIPGGPPSLPAPTICRLCGLASAKLTLRHGARQHSRPLYCQKCALDAVRQRLACPLCGAPADGVANVGQ